MSAVPWFIDWDKKKINGVLVLYMLTEQINFASYTTISIAELD